MNDDKPENWDRLARALFGARDTTDGEWFVERVMRQVRRLEIPGAEILWLGFRRWALPALAMAAAGFALALWDPEPTAQLSTETLLAASEPVAADAVTVLLGGDQA